MQTSTILIWLIGIILFSSLVCGVETNFDIVALDATDDNVAYGADEYGWNLTLNVSGVVVNVSKGSLDDAQDFRIWNSTYHLLFTNIGIDDSDTWTVNTHLGVGQYFFMATNRSGGALATLHYKTPFAQTSFSYGTVNQSMRNDSSAWAQYANFATLESLFFNPDQVGDVILNSSVADSSSVSGGGLEFWGNWTGSRSPNGQQCILIRNDSSGTITTIGESHTVGVNRLDDYVGYWDFNGNPNDHSYAGDNDGTVGGQAGSVTNDTGVMGTAYHFNGSTGQVIVNDSTSVRNYHKNNYTISFWTKFTQGGQMGFFTIYEIGGSGYTAI